MCSDCLLVSLKEMSWFSTFDSWEKSKQPPAGSIIGTIMSGKRIISNNFRAAKSKMDLK